MRDDNINGALAANTRDAFLLLLEADADTSGLLRCRRSFEFPLSPTNPSQNT